MHNSQPPLANFNPFSEAAAGKYFVGRENQLRQFQQYSEGLKEKSPNHLYVAGLHGTGKTSYLVKVLEIASTNGLLAVLHTLDPDRLPREQIMTIVKAIIVGLQEHILNAGYSQYAGLERDWESNNDSKFFSLPRSDKLESDRLVQDFKTLRKLMQESGVPGVVLCIDEGQRIDPIALSALKNSLQHLDTFLVVLSLRLVDDKGGPVAAGRALLAEKALQAEGDIGAGRFFVTGVPMGPFDTDVEAADCIRRRLLSNRIQFDDEVIRRIARIAGRIPRAMISLASSVYDHAASDSGDGLTIGVTILDETFRSVFRSELGEALALHDAISEADRTALQGLLRIRRVATTEEVANFLYPSLPNALKPSVVEGIRSGLDRVSSISNLILKLEKSYQVADSVHAYALELTLGMD